jgi:hypothetical protein
MTIDGGEATGSSGGESICPVAGYTARSRALFRSATKLGAIASSEPHGEEAL